MTSLKLFFFNLLLCRLFFIFVAWTYHLNEIKSALYKITAQCKDKSAHKYGCCRQRPSSHWLSKKLRLAHTHGAICWHKCENKKGLMQICQDKHGCHCLHGAGRNVLSRQWVKCIVSSLNFSKIVSN